VKIDVRPGGDRDEAFYAIKDQGTDRYITATWNKGKGRDPETCGWLHLEHKVSIIARDEPKARSRFEAVRQRLKDSVGQGRNARDASEHAQEVTRLLDGDLVLVRVRMRLEVTEAVV
jgi:hypothetical protein